MQGSSVPTDRHIYYGWVLPLTHTRIKHFHKQTDDKVERSHRQTYIQVEHHKQTDVRVKCSHRQTDIRVKCSHWHIQESSIFTNRHLEEYCLYSRLHFRTNFYNVRVERSHRQMLGSSVPTDGQIYRAEMMSFSLNEESQTQFNKYFEFVYFLWTLNGPYTLWSIT